MSFVRVALALFLVLAGFCLMVQPVHATANAVIQNDTAWLDRAGYYHVTGEVKNTGDVWLHYVIAGVRVTGAFLDAHGGRVDTVDAFVQLDYLPPGEVGPFDLLEFNATLSAQIVNYTLALAYQASTPLSVKLIVQNISQSRDILGDLVVTGQVQNQGDAFSKFTKVIGTFYDAQGRVVADALTFTDPTDLPPGAVYPFKLIMLYASQGDRVAHYTIVAESQVYTSVPEGFPVTTSTVTTGTTSTSSACTCTCLPTTITSTITTATVYTSVTEWPWPILTVGIALTLAIAALRKKKTLMK
jgi:hypothetical protein